MLQNLERFFHLFWLKSAYFYHNIRNSLNNPYQTRSKYSKK